MIKKTVFLLFLIVFFSTARPSCAAAFDIWQYPEMAESHAIFFSVFFTRFSFVNYFSLYYPEITLDYLLPVGIPISVGASVQFFDPKLSSYGFRLGYHFNFNDENLDIYVLYNASLVLSGDDIWLEYGGMLGFRRRLFPFLCITVETRFKLQTIFFGFSAKLY